MLLVYFPLMFEYFDCKSTKNIPYLIIYIGKNLPIFQKLYFSFGILI